MATYYIDFTNGLDTNAGTSTGAAWQTINKYTNATRSLGDICIVRRGMTHPTIAADINFVSDGNINNYITLKGDNGQAWTADESQLGTGTNTNVTFGSTTVTVSGEDVTGTIAAGDGFKLAGDVRVYEVKTVSFSTDTTITLYLPYREITQTGVTSYRVPSLPLVDFAGSYQVRFLTDHHWKLKDLDFRASTDASGMVTASSSIGIILDGLVLRDCIASNVEALVTGRDIGIFRTRFSGNTNTGCINASLGTFLNIKDCLFDGNSWGIRTFANGYIENTTFSNNTSGDIEPGSGGILICRNVSLLSTTTIANYTGVIQEYFKAFFEDYGGVKGDNRRFYTIDETQGVATIQSETTTVRSGGGTTSIKCTPSTEISTDNINSRVLLNEWIIDADTTSKTYTVYFNLPAADFTAAPLATELYLEVEYLENASAVERIVETSTGTVLADGNWNTITITAQPNATGLLYLRAYYAKTKESGKTNINYTDTVIGIT